MDNLYLYNKYCQVPQNALKPFDNGKFKGTDINTMWRIKCLTEEFGVCGIGWYPEIVRTWTENGANDETLCFAEIKLYIKVNGEWSKGISATGGSAIIQFVKSGQYHKSNDDGFKMAITDALGVACKLLGFGADIYWAHGRSKYTTDDGAENKKQPQKNDQNQTVTKKKEKPAKKELFEKYGYLAFEKECAGYERRLGNIPFDEWDDEIFELVENDMKERQRKHERKAQLSMVNDADIPFPLEGNYAERED